MNTAQQIEALLSTCVDYEIVDPGSEDQALIVMFPDGSQLHMTYETDEVENIDKFEYWVTERKPAQTADPVS